MISLLSQDKNGRISNALKSAQLQMKFNQISKIAADLTPEMRKKLIESLK